MKSFIKNTLLFCLPVLCLSYPIDIYISHRLKNSNDYYGEFEVWNDLFQGDINANILIYGSSRAWVNINPKILENSLKTSAYNLGMDGHNFWLQYLRHLEYLKYNTKPKQIILAVDFGSLQKREDLYLYEQFLPYMLWNENIQEFTQTYEGLNYFDYTIPLVRYIGQPSVLKNAFKLNINTDTDSTYRVQGYKGVDLKWSKTFDPNNFKEGLFNKALDPKSIELFDRFLLECKNSNINVTLVYTPEYIEGHNILKFRESSIELFTSYAEKYNLLFLDYSEHSICHSKSNFYNVTHLNKTGSELFSQALVQDLITLNTQQNNTIEDAKQEPNIN